MNFESNEITEPSLNKDYIEQLITRLKDEHENVRIETINGLANTGVVMPIIEAFKDDSSQVRYAVRNALTQIADPKVIYILLNLLNADDNFMRNSAIYTLGAFGERALVPLTDALKNVDPKTRAGAVRALGLLKSQTRTPKLRLPELNAVEPLIQALKDEDNVVRAEAASSLAKFRDARAVIPLIALLNDKDSDVRYYVLKSLGSIGDKRAVEPLLVFLQNRSKPSEIAIESLGRLGDTRAVDPLIAILTNKAEALKLRESAAWALGKIKDSQC